MGAGGRRSLFFVSPSRLRIAPIVLHAGRLVSGFSRSSQARSFRGPQVGCFDRSYGELSDVCRRHDTCRPEQLLDGVKLAAELARVRANGGRVTRDRLAGQSQTARGRIDAASQEFRRYGLKNSRERRDSRPSVCRSRGSRVEQLGP